MPSSFRVNYCRGYDSFGLSPRMRKATFDAAATIGSRHHENTLCRRKKLTLTKLLVPKQSPLLARFHYLRRTFARTKMRSKIAIEGRHERPWLKAIQDSPHSLCPQ